MIARHFQHQEGQLVARPATGSILLASEVARQLGLHSIFAEREDKTMAFRRGPNITPGEPVLVVDNMLTTGGFLYEVIAEKGKSR